MMDIQKNDQSVGTSQEIIRTEKIFNAGFGVNISFRNISYSVWIKDKQQKPSKIPCKQHYIEKPILRNVSGIFHSGTVNAIMGASGAGKTTLLNILACRINPSEGGELFANKESYDGERLGYFANYVMQSDILMDTLTVRETLQFASRVKLRLTDKQRQQRMKKLIKELKLEKCLDTLVGGQLVKGVSGGQKKRLSIAVELISNPEILFLDEPTSGLDSLTSYIIISYFRQLAEMNQKTIIMSIHQPSEEIFRMFDKLVLLVEGRLIYQDRAIDAPKYFSTNFGLQLPQFSNPSDFIMSKIHFHDEKNRERFPKYFETYTHVVEPRVQRQIEDRSEDRVKERTFGSGFLIGLKALLYRNFINIVRNPLLLRSKLLQRPIIALFMGGMYFGTGDDDYTNSSIFYTISGFFFFNTLTVFVSTLLPTALTFPKQKLLFFKEQNSKMYSTLQYFISKSLIEIPQQLINPIIAVGIYYWMIGLGSTFEQLFIHFLVYYLLAFAGSSIGYLLGGIIEDEKTVIPAGIIVVMPMLVFAGFFKNREDLSSWISWVEFLSPNKYAFSAWLQNEVKGRGSLISQFNFDLGIWQAVAILAGMGVLLRVIAYVFLLYFKRKLQ